jgi:TolB protein
MPRRGLSVTVMATVALDVLGLYVGAAVPETEKIAFVSDREGSPQIYVMNADGSGVTRLTSPPARSLAPTFSPDGHTIAFASDREGSMQISVMSADGSRVSRLTNPPGSYRTPVFSPDGQEIAFVSQEGIIYRWTQTDRT